LRFLYPNLIYICYKNYSGFVEERKRKSKNATSNIITESFLNYFFKVLVLQGSSVNEEVYKFY
jgi:hypothetical protein